MLRSSSQIWSLENSHHNHVFGESKFREKCYPKVCEAMITFFGRLLVMMTGVKWSFFLYFGIGAGCPDLAITFHFIQCSPGIVRRVINIHLNLTDFEENKPTHALLSDFLQANSSGRW